MKNNPEAQFKALMDYNPSTVMEIKEHNFLLKAFMKKTSDKQMSKECSTKLVSNSLLESAYWRSISN